MKHIHYTILDQTAPDEVDECIRKLFTAIIHRAILDLFSKHHTSDKRDATFWLLESGDDVDNAFSFAWICHYLAIDKNKIADKLRQMLLTNADINDPSVQRILRTDSSFYSRPVAPVHYARKNMPSNRKTIPLIRMRTVK